MNAPISNKICYKNKQNILLLSFGKKSLVELRLKQRVIIIIIMHRLYKISLLHPMKLKKNHFILYVYMTYCNNCDVKKLQYF